MREEWRAIAFLLVGLVVGCDGGVAPESSWQLRVASGSVSNNRDWDPPGGAPDPFVCLTIVGVRTCTPTRTDTYSPSWGFPFPVATAAALKIGVGVEYADEDPTGSGTICNTGIVPVLDEDFASGTWGVDCAPYGSFDAELVPR